VTAPTELPLADGDRTGATARDDVIVAAGLQKRYDSFTAVHGLDLVVHRGEAFGFLGPNGAGKSSTMRMIAGVSPPSGGRLHILGHDVATDATAVRARLGVVPQDDTLDGDLTVQENLLIYGRYFDLPWKESRARARRLLDFAELSDWADHRVDQLSGGMRRRLTIARALINEPDILLLDEPTTGLDPQARHLVWDRLASLKADGVTLVLTTHYLDEAEELCDRIVVIDGGREVAAGTPPELIARYAGREVVEVGAGADGRVHDAVTRLDGRARTYEVLRDRVLAYTDDGDALALALEGQGLPPHRVRVRRATLEDVFLILTGRSLDGPGGRE
jgi:lipooligosaccharide transport system ATP-binding protein